MSFGHDTQTYESRGFGVRFGAQRFGHALNFQRRVIRLIRRAQAAKAGDTPSPGSKSFLALLPRRLCFKVTGLVPGEALHDDPQGLQACGNRRDGSFQQADECQRVIRPGPPP